MERINNYFPQNDNVGYSPVTDSIKCHNLISSRSGDSLKNQFVISYPCALVRKFQSYDTICLTWDGVSRVLTVYPEAFGYSVTTSKYSRAFLRDDIGLDDSDIDNIRTIAKTDSFGRDCPHFIQC